MDPDIQAECRTDEEVRFLAHLESGATGLGDVWLWDSFPLITTRCVGWVDGPPILRTLRADFDGTQVRCGNDPNHNMDLPLDRSDPDYLEGPGSETPEVAADIAARWFRAQLDRAIDQYEWNDGNYRRWVLADTGVLIGSQVSGGLGWQSGGAWDRAQPPPAKSPDLIMRVWPRAK